MYMATDRIYAYRQLYTLTRALCRMKKQQIFNCIKIMLILFPDPTIM